MREFKSATPDANHNEEYEAGRRFNHLGEVAQGEIVYIPAFGPCKVICTDVIGYLNAIQVQCLNGHRWKHVIRQEEDQHLGDAIYVDERNDVYVSVCEAIRIDN